MKCLIIDDEPLALNQLCAYISQVPFLTLVKACTDAFSAMEIMAEEEIDLIFTDIDMPDLSGIEFVKSLVSRPVIIFTTAYAEYALEGYKIEVADYLLKPFDFQDFLLATDKARKQWAYRNPVDSIIMEDDLETDTLFIKSDDNIFHINVSDIRYIEGRGEYVRIFMEDMLQPIISLLDINQLEEKLSNKHFMRIHSYYIINLNKIKKISRMRNILIGDRYLTIGKNYEQVFINYIQNRYVGK